MADRSIKAEYAVRGATVDQVQSFAFDRGPIGCVLLHGFTAAPKEMRPLGEYLAARNFTVRGVRYAGHGTCPQDLAHTTWRDWAASAEEAVTELRSGCTQVWSIGLSLGGLISLQLAGQQRVDGVCAIAPAIFPPDRRMAIARFLAPFMRYTRKGLADLHDPVALAEHADYELFPTRAVAQLHSLMLHTRRRLKQIDVPLLLILARHDQVVSLDALDFIWPRVRSTDKEYLILERGGHIVTEDYDKATAFEAVARFLQKHRPA
ncbi:Thermostable monoacylglycerol lipase [Thermoflexales bacterium]|nr:Thermostable monoacylglycerol lipase [Thermoflexales bacterium]